MKELRFSGLRIFATPFNKFDGFGDGPEDYSDPTSPGGRPMLQNNGTFLRVNGLDAQTCLECHSIISMAAIPFKQGIGGFGGINASALFQPRLIAVADKKGKGYASFDGRLINPPALFGVGAVQLVAREMTEQLQELKKKALSNPGKPVKLLANDIHFGTIVADASGNLDVSGVEGVDTDLIVRPFGRKGQFSSVRQFDLGAMMFHFGMQPVEVAGENVDADNDGVTNEVLIGEISVLEIFLTTQERPFMEPETEQTKKGLKLFKKIGCADCHVPETETTTTVLTYSFPEVETDSAQNVFYSFDLSSAPPSFETREGGLVVRMFSDLKRHDMGDVLAESFSYFNEQENREFITAKLWGVADTAPYLHDGRAMTLNEAITLHGGEAQAAREAFLALDTEERNEILSFLMSLRDPENPNQDVLSS